jgi:hypothetical protein
MTVVGSNLLPQAKAWSIFFSKRSIFVPIRIGLS